jgi:formyltetrahydrofolate synthetase
MQTTEGTPSLVHGGPFANIAYGNSSVIADQIAVKLADYTVTESGFGADMGFEKLVNIKSRASGLPVDATVLVATIRALKAHSGRFKISAGKPLDPALLERDLDAVRDGLVNLQRHVEIVRAHGVPVIVALNHFETDHPDEVDLVLKSALDMGAVATAASRVHAEGGAGGEALAEAVAQVAESGVSEMKPLYDLSLSLEEKIRIQAQTLYGARDIELSDVAKAAIDRIEGWGYREMPICMAKTHLSLSHDPKLKGAPTDFIFPVRDVRLAAGAGFVYPLAGEMRLMPGLGSRPALRQVDIDDRGQVIGLF